MKVLLFLTLVLMSVDFAFAADGDLDVSFGVNGIVAETIYSSFASNTSVVVQPDGKILVAGYGTNLTPTQVDFYVSRYNPDGSPDTSFGTNGRIFADVLGKTDNFPEVFVQTDGRIVIAGQSQDAGNVPRISIFRFNGNGTVDASFGTNGSIVSNFTTSGTRGDVFGDAVLQPDGRIVVAGQWFGTSFCVARFDAAGALDTAFGETGSRCAQTVPFGVGVMRSLALQPDGKIVAAGRYQTSFTDPADFIVLRFDSNGSLDTSFDGDGYAITDVNSNYDEAYSVHVLPDGRILAVGRAGLAASTQYGFGAVRYGPNGALDVTFDGDGKTIAFPRNTAGSEKYAAVVMANGKLVAARHVSPTSGFFDDGQIMRFNENGSIDTTFGASGQILVPSVRIIGALARQTDGKIIAVGLGEDNRAYTLRYSNTDVAPPAANPALRVSDFDGDGRTDSAVYRGGSWFVGPSGSPSSYFALDFGLPNDRVTAADFDGDGRTDIAVWRPAEGNYYILNSTNATVRVDNFGLAGDVPVAADFDGDGRADVATYREGSQSYFFYRGSLNNPAGNITYLPWGISGDQAVRGDFDGDGKFDPAVFRPSTAQWIIRRSTDQSVVYQWFGLAGDRRVTADYDGDRKSDIAVFRDGIWYILQSSNGQIRYTAWGLASDTPVPGDYDGDGRADIAVFRNGVFYISESSTGNTAYRNFGASGDLPVAAAANP